MRQKSVSMGDAGEKKSCLTKPYCKGKFHERYTSTSGGGLGDESGAGSGRRAVNLRDLAEVVEHRERRKELYADAEEALLVSAL